MTSATSAGGGNATGKRNTAIGALIGFLAVCVLGVSIVTLVKVYSTDTPVYYNSTDGDTQAQSALNIPGPAALSSDASAGKRQSYQDYVNLLHSNLNLSQSPCNDFYEYACGASQELTFRKLFTSALEAAYSQLISPAYINKPALPKPVKQASVQVQKCVDVLSGKVSQENVGRVEAHVLELASRLGHGPTFNVPTPTDQNQTVVPLQPLTARQLAAAVGYLSRADGTETLVTTDVETNWRQPHGAQPYALVIDQAKLSLPDIYFQKVWDLIKDQHRKSIDNALRRYSTAFNLIVDEGQLSESVDSILQLEYDIAVAINTPADERRQFERSYNLHTVWSAGQQFPDFDFAVYIEEAYGSALTRKQFILTEPDALRRLLDHLRSQPVDTVVNYLFYRLIQDNLNYLPSADAQAAETDRRQQLEAHYRAIMRDIGRLGRPGGQSKRDRRTPRRPSGRIPHFPGMSGLEARLDTSKSSRAARSTVTEKELQYSQLVCTYYNALLLPYPNARAYIDATYPDASARGELRAGVAQFINSVVDGFQGMLSQLDWMSGESKKGAFGKVANLVKNIAWPDFLLDDAALTAAYSAYTFNETDTLESISDELHQVGREADVQQILQAKDAQRDDFLASPTMVNAWYMPMYNSITFPLAILQPPFYDPNLPAAVNYGGLGVVAGHELTHAFDDQGVQWDGVGALHRWIDADSQSSFNSMAQCVADEYSAFAPTARLHIDGQQTLGENIADNGGIHAAYRAYQARRDLLGADPQLPDKRLKAFTQDQLFFVNFAQVWCEPPPSEESIIEQLLLDPHSPAKYRVLGTVQNIPAFRAAFNCPADSVYAPSKHCEVWVSPSNDAVGIPPTELIPAPLNIAVPSPSTSAKYEEAARLLEQPLDTSFEPCADFVEYSSGASDQIVGTNDPVIAALANGLAAPAERNELPPITAAKAYFSSCVSSLSDWPAVAGNGDLVVGLTRFLRGIAQVNFPLIDDADTGSSSGSSSGSGSNEGTGSAKNSSSSSSSSSSEEDMTVHKTKMDDEFEGYLIGVSLAELRARIASIRQDSLKEGQEHDYNDGGDNWTPLYWGVISAFLSHAFHTDVFVRSYVDTNWPHPQSAISLDSAQPYNLFIDQGPLTLPQAAYTSPNTWPSQKPVAVQQVADLLFRYVQADARVNGKNATVSQSQLNATATAIVELEEIIASQVLSDEAARRNFVRMHNPVDVKKQETVGFISINAYAALSALFGASDDGSTVQHVVVPEPEVFNKFVDLIQNTDPDTIKNYLFYRLITTYAEYLPEEYSIQPATKTKSVSLNQRDNNNLGDISPAAAQLCATEIADKLPEVSSRLAVQQLYESAEARETVRQAAGAIAANVQAAVRSSLQTVSWLDADSKAAALAKIDATVVNIGWSDAVFDDAQLTEEYEQLSLKATAPIYQTRHVVDTFVWKRQIAQLSKHGVTDRASFDAVSWPTVAENPVLHPFRLYQPKLNSISIPLTLLQSPYFDPEWPAAINYAGLGFRIAEAIGHQFDEIGVQWGQLGELKPWLSAASKPGFQNVVDCLANQQVAPAVAVADIVGADAALRGLLSHIQHDGSGAEALPGRFASQLTAEQTYFLRLAQTIDSKPEDAGQRVKHVIRNTPAFHAAFNCPVPSSDADTQCAVYNEAPKYVAGIPDVSTTPLPLNIATPAPAPANNTKYAEAAAYFAANVDPSHDPCENFYDYTCARMTSPMYFDAVQYESIAEAAAAIDAASAARRAAGTAPATSSGSGADDDDSDYGSDSHSGETASPKKLPLALNTALNYYDSCLKSGENPDKTSVETFGLAIQLLENFREISSFPFPVIDNPGHVYTFPDPTALGGAIGYLRGISGTDTLVSLFVDTNWGAPQSNQPYMLFIDQPSLLLPTEFYGDAIWPSFKESYIRSVAEIFVEIGPLFNPNATVSADVARFAAERIADFERLLATEFSTSDDVRRNFSHMFNQTTLLDYWIEQEAITTGAYLYFSLMAAPDEVLTRVFQFDYNMVIAEPAHVFGLKYLLRDFNRYGFHANVLYNYLNLRALLAAFGTASTGTLRYVDEMLPHTISLRRPAVGRPRWEKDPLASRPKLFEMAEKSEALRASPVSRAVNPRQKIRCAVQTLVNLPYSAARIHIDAVLPATRQRREFRRGVDDVVENVLNGFRSMLDGLRWMSASTRAGAYEKIDKLVRNIGYPDFITDDKQLDAYYHLGEDFDFVLQNADDFVLNHFLTSIFSLGKDLQPLAAINGTERTDFNGIPAIVNAWYQPELNSITFPLGILKQPFYDAEWPTAVNYGAIGVVAGHELTHGFDDEGVQFDATGRLNRWMDSASTRGFKRMAQCVINEYSGICPLNEADYTPNCINGVQTQGENIADNGGIRAAFRAYRNAIGLRGGDPQLPDSLIGRFTNDQLFFLSFAQVWCEPEEPKAEDTYMQLLLDPHSPSRARVFGTLKNFPAFRNAFNCPAGAAYAPEKHCDVWVSEPKHVVGLPATAAVGADAPSLNIPKKAPAKLAAAASTSVNPHYAQAAAFFEASVDTSQSPCDNFYEYACNNYQDDISFGVIDFKNIYDVAVALRREDDETVEPIQKAKTLFKQCKKIVSSRRALIDEINADDIATQFYNEFKAVGGLPHPAFDGGAPPTDWPSATALGRAVGYLSGGALTDTLLTFFTFTNFENPTGAQPYAMFLDQCQLGLPDYIYEQRNWDIYQDLYGDIIESILMRMARHLNITLDVNALDNSVQDILDFEYALFTNFHQPDEERDLAKLYNWQSVGAVADANPRFDLRAFLKQLTASASPEVRDKVNDDNYHFVFTEPTKFAKLLEALQNDNDYGFTPTQLYNYLYFRLLWTYNNYIPVEEDIVARVANRRTAGLSNRRAKTTTQKQTSHDELTSHVLYRPPLGRPRYVKRKYNPKTYDQRVEKMMALNERLATAAAAANASLAAVGSARRDASSSSGSSNEDDQPIRRDDFICAEVVIFNMDVAATRVYVDEALPSRQKRSSVVHSARQLLSSILLSFRSLVEQIGWMSADAKSAAYAKIAGITGNVAYPEQAVNNSQLTEYYAALDIKDSDNFFQISMKLNFFAYNRMFETLARTELDRTEFNSGAVFVNAWYQPQLNSITLPASILQPPFFHPKYPLAVNYGAMGVVVGHELSHGFDNGGVNWDANGKLAPWLDAGSQTAFDKMAQCVIDEYDQFCPMPDGFHIEPSCINGERTQGENIADNGGIHASFRAYRNALEVRGGDDALPSALVGQFSNDQLFFLSFAQPWCEHESLGETYDQLVYDVHSPSKYRILGTLRNFPAFKEAFNCLAGSAYAPKDHCNVWISDVPENAIVASDASAAGNAQSALNVPTPAPIAADQPAYTPYQRAVGYLKAAVDVHSSSPCDDFPAYACGAYKSSVSFARYAWNNYMRIGWALERAEPSVSTALQKFADVYSYCNATLPSLEDHSDEASAYVIGRLDNLAKETKLDFTVFDDKKKTKALPDPRKLAKALALLSAGEGVDTFVWPSVDPELSATAPKANKLFFDQPQLTYAKSFYEPGTWELIRPTFYENSYNMLKRYANATGVTFDEPTVATKLNALLDFEVQLARDYMTAETSRRDFSRFNNKLTLHNANSAYKLLHWETYVQELVKIAGVKTETRGRWAEAFFMETDVLKRLSSDLTDATKFDPDTVVNYLFFRLLIQNARYLPRGDASLIGEYRAVGATIAPRHGRRPRAAGVDEDADPFRPWDFEAPAEGAADCPSGTIEGSEGACRCGAVAMCAGQAAHAMPLAAARFYTDLRFPTADERIGFKNTTTRLVNAIRNAFRSMLEELNWLDASTRSAAFAKLDQLQVNIAYTDALFENGPLDAAYDALHIDTSTDTYFDVRRKLTIFAAHVQYQMLNEPVNRAQLLGTTTDVNAYYDGSYNSINLLEGIIREPYFGAEWPAAVNFGNLGTIIGHEISHGFDDTGVQFDATGALVRWMSASSQAAFDQMAQCIVDEYGAVQVLDPAHYQPANVSGANTQGENIADNAGIQAAYRAFVAHTAVEGPDASLPDSLFGGFTQEQLFFLSFAQTWCEAPPSADRLYFQLLVDTHSPHRIRLQETLRNFPAFRAAFNCPAGAPMAPLDRCRVWQPTD